jgi:alpha-beta hydrolase superfamily lysophospholipase
VFACADGTRVSGMLHRSPHGGGRGVLVVPGLGSRASNHTDFAKAAAEAGISTLAIDLRGHGDTGGELDGGALDDVRQGLCELTSLGCTRLAIRGSSMGAMLALAVACGPPKVAAVVAICPARPAALARRIEADWPNAIDLHAAVATPGVARGYWHATGDAQVPWAASWRLFERSPHPRRLRITVGGSHTSLQHDPRVIAETIDFLVENLAG